MKNSSTADDRIRNLLWSTLYPLCLSKVERKGRTAKELDEVLEWLTGYDAGRLHTMQKEDVSLELFFQRANVNPKSEWITGVICGYRVEEIQDPLMQRIRYMDKLVDELAQGKTLDKILRSELPRPRKKKG